MNDDDYYVDDILSSPKKKKINSKDKGKRGELDLCSVFSKRFTDKKGFFRVVGSGNRWSHVVLTEQAKEMFTGDVVCPEGFRFCIECKYGYKDIDLSSCFVEGDRELDKFLVQAEKDAKMVGRCPLLCWKKPRQKWLVFTKENLSFTYTMKYRDWFVVGIDDFLSLPDSFYFQTPK